MPLFKTTDVTETPKIEITRWKIYKVTSELWAEQTLHLVGYNNTEHHGRVSSSIIQFTKDNIVTTESGRQYKLIGDSGYDPDAAYVWGVWCLRNEVREFFDVTGEYL